jgi:hypothetical protein
VPVTTLVIALVLAAVIVESSRRRGRGWGAFLGWCGAGLLSALATISFAIGIFVLPFAVVAIAIASRFGLWPAALGFLGGVGLVGPLVSALNVGERDSSSYYGWLAVGSVLTLASALSFAAFRRAT